MGYEQILQVQKKMMALNLAPRVNCREKLDGTVGT
jgi:hypothetical protein